MKNANKINNLMTKAQAKELSEIVGNSQAFGEHLGRISKAVSVSLDGYDEEAAKEIRAMMFDDELPNECPAYAEGYEFNEELGGHYYHSEDVTGSESNRKNATDFEGVIGWGSESTTQIALDNLKFFVAPLACWKKSAVKDESGRVISKGGFDAEKFERHSAKVSKERAYHDIAEIIFDKAGRVKSLNGDKKPRRQRVARAATRNAKKS